MLNSRNKETATCTTSCVRHKPFVHQRIYLESDTLAPTNTPRTCSVVSATTGMMTCMKSAPTTPMSAAKTRYQRRRSQRTLRQGNRTHAERHEAHASVAHAQRRPARRQRCRQECVVHRIAPVRRQAAPRHDALCPSRTRRNRRRQENADDTIIAHFASLKTADLRATFARPLRNQTGLWINL